MRRFLVELILQYHKTWSHGVRLEDNVTTFAGRYGGPTMLGLSYRVVSNVLSRYYQRLLRQYAAEWQGEATFYQLKTLKCNCHFDVSSFEAKLPVFGLRMLIIDGLPTRHEELPADLDISDEGLYCVVEPFGEANHHLDEEVVKQFVEEFATDLRTSR